MPASDLISQILMMRSGMSNRQDAELFSREHMTVPVQPGAPAGRMHDSPPGMFGPSAYRYSMPPATRLLNYDRLLGAPTYQSIPGEGTFSGELMNRLQNWRGSH